MMLHIFVEEPSAKNVLEVIIPKIIPADIYFRVYPHQGKNDLEHALKSTVPSISRIPGARILIVRDQDSADCAAVKKHLQKIIKNKCSSPTMIRIVCRELESWFLGDLNAISKAYPRLNPAKVASKADFRNVDLIQNTHEYLLGIIPEYSELDRLPKLEVSQSIAPHLDLENNTSTSFRHFITGVKKLIAAP